MKNNQGFNKNTSKQFLGHNLSSMANLTGVQKLQKAKQILNFPDANVLDFVEDIYSYILSNNELYCKSAMYLLAIMANYKWSDSLLGMGQKVSNKLIRLASENYLQFQHLKHLFKIDILNDLLIINAREQLERQETNEMKYVLILTNLCKDQLKTLTYNSILLAKNMDSKKIMNLLQETLNFFIPHSQKNIQLYLNLLLEELKLMKEIVINNKSHQNFNYLAQRITQTLYNLVYIYHGDQNSHKDAYLNDQIYRNYYIQFQHSICISLDELFQSGLQQVYNNHLIRIVNMISRTISSFKFSKMIKKLIQCSTQSTFIQINKFQTNRCQCKQFYRDLLNNILHFFFAQHKLQFIKQPNFLLDQIKGDVAQLLFCILQKISDSTFMLSLQKIKEQYKSKQSQIIIYYLKSHHDIKKKGSTNANFELQHDLEKQINLEINQVLQSQSQNINQFNRFNQFNPFNSFNPFNPFNQFNQFHQSTQYSQNQRKYLKINFLLVCLRKRLSSSLQTKNYFLKDQNFQNCFQNCIKLLVSQTCVAQSAQLLIQLFKKKFVDKTNYFQLKVVETNKISKIHQYFIRILNYFRQNSQKMKILKESIFQQIIKLLITLLKQRVTQCTEPIFKQIFTMLQYLDGSSNLKYAVQLFQFTLNLPFYDSEKISYHLQDYAQKILILSNQNGQSYLINIFLMFIQKFKYKSLRQFFLKNQTLFWEINHKHQKLEQKHNNNISIFNYQNFQFQQITAKSVQDIFKLLIHSQKPLTQSFIFNLLNCLQIALNQYTNKQDNPQIRKQISLQVFNLYINNLPKYFKFVEETAIFGKSLSDKINCLSKILKLLIRTLNCRQSFNIPVPDCKHILSKIKYVYQKISNFVYRTHNGTDQSIQQISRFQQANYNLKKLLLLTLALYQKQVNDPNMQELFYYQKYLILEKQIMKLIQNKSKKNLQIHVNIKKENLLFCNEQSQCFWPLLTESLLKFQRY